MIGAPGYMIGASIFMLTKQKEPHFQRNRLYYPSDRGLLNSASLNALIQKKIIK